MSKLAIFCPTYKRPDKLWDLIKNIEDATKNSHMIYFGVELDDIQSQHMVTSLPQYKNVRLIINKYEPGYANTIQSCYEASREPFFIHANDDFEFHKNWDEVPLAMFDRKDLMVVGMKQTEGDTHGSAISMIRREYIEKMSGVIDIPDRVFYPYNHNFVDTEFTQTAKSRGVWAMCDPRVITHKHPGFTGADKDATHHKNDATVEIDKKTFESRKHLWGQ